MRKREQLVRSRASLIKPSTAKKKKERKKERKVIADAALERMKNSVPLLQLTVCSIAVPMIPLGKQMPNAVRALHSDDPVVVENSLYETNVLETYV